MSKRKKPRKQKLGVKIADPESAEDLTKAGAASPLHQRVTGWVQGHRFVSALVAIALFVGVASAVRYLDEDAKRQKVLAAKDRTVLASINPFLSPPDPTPTPQLSKEYLYAGSRLLAVEDANANAAPPADLAVWRPSTGVWYVLGGDPEQTVTTYEWGASSDKHAPGDYDGDGKTDFAVYRQSNGTWYIVNSSDGSFWYPVYGGSSDLPAPADFDGDGKTDLVLYRASNNTFYVTKSTGGTAGIQLGSTGDVAIPHDYDGDGLADFAVWRDSNHTFYTINSSNPSTGQTVDFGATGDTPVPADYDGDGKADFATFIGGTWKIRSSITSSSLTLSPNPYGTSGDIPVPNDYDGDGKCDRAIWRPSNGYWWIRQSATDTDRAVQWGASGDIPVPAYYRR